ncbi:enoyl-CoA hydratase/isomerase family protein [Bacillus shivajii]|uniref:enoyl-CoA hydratase/isomerase family protein n=1 Tax=Bacillus shivajii TaxID=1983719 RepID=UPI001CFB5E4B|nr:enoyl-CoA hydratase/isomerase family protein [Bacillus shivajii]UCZ51839.1 enoyl-CoA hydratase/isomerase family protein [Bacillus shivajii]
MKVCKQYINEHVAEIVLNRPKQKNAVDFDVIEQLDEHITMLANDENITVLILRGEGGAFCSGGDLRAFHQLMTKEDAKTMLQPMNDVLKKIVSFPGVTVSYIDGAAVGGGAELATSTDYRLASPNCKVGFIQGRLHLTTGWGGASILKDRIGREVALQMLGSGRLYSPVEAKEIGFVQEVVSSLDEVYDWAERWLQSPQVIRNYKALLYKEKEKLYTEMDQEVSSCSSLWETEEHHSAVKNFLEKSQ